MKFAIVGLGRMGRSLGQLDWPAAKAIALLRNQFGGHPIHRGGDRDRS